MTLGGKTFKEGDWISLNGNTGEVIDQFKSTSCTSTKVQILTPEELRAQVIEGKEPLSPPIMAGDLGTFMRWVSWIKY